MAATEIKNVIFDLDGTLLDTRQGVLDAVVYTIKELGYVMPSDEVLKTFIGPPIQLSFMNTYGVSKEKAQKAADVFRNFYSTKTLLEAEPYDGIYELCEQLKKKGYQLAVATYKREDYALNLLNHYHFDEYCDPMHGADNMNVLKKEDIVDMCINEMGGAKEDSVLIGDTMHDGTGAEKAGVSFIAVTYGFGFREGDEIKVNSLLGVAKKPVEILDILN